MEEEESAFEDDTRSGTSSFSSIHKKENIREQRKYKTSGKVYHYTKEIYLTEKTYVKDLEVLTISFRGVVENVLSESLLKLLFDNIDPLYDFHCSLMAELEERVNNWYVRLILVTPVFSLILLLTYKVILSHLRQCVICIPPKNVRKSLVF